VRIHVNLILVLAAAGAVIATPVYAQTNVDPSAPLTQFGDGIVDQFDPASEAILFDPLAIEARIAPATADRPALLVISARVAPGRHTYSLTQPPGGPNPVRIKLTPANDYRQLAPFRAYPEPSKRIEQGPVWTGLEIQEHEGDVTWYAPIEITAGVDPQSLEIRGTIHAEVCETGGYCVPVQKDIAAAVDPSAAIGFPIADFPGQPAIGNRQSAAMQTFQAQGSVVQITGRLEPAQVRPGESTQLLITATVPAGWHVYAYSPRDNKRGSKPTLIALSTTSGLIPHRPETNAPIKIDNSVPAFGPMQYHEGSVTWTTRLEVPQNAPPGEYRIAGLVGYQACEYRPDGTGSCELSHAARFTGTLQVGSERGGGSSPLDFAPAENYKEAATLAAVFADYLDKGAPEVQQASAEPPSRTASQSEDARAVASETQRAQVPAIRSADAYDLDRLQVEATSGTLPYYLALAFVGGLILNLMPCVLPVIGLKVMSFVEQAGRNRSHALVLNLWYAAGIVAVFLLLGILAATINLSWGGQFGNTAFNATIAAVVFAMALSLLGVWEVPIPGFIGSGSVQSAASKEGPVGAFLKGVVTTILATPCTAPAMATAVAWAVTQPVATTLAVFASLGIGMASPYVLVGVFPELLRFLPKPGRWMETFKQISGFVLLATVVFILSFMEPAAVVPTVALLMGIGVACWLIARTPLTAELRDRLQTWALAGAVVLLFVAVSFGWLYRDVMQPRFAGQQAARAAVDGRWQPFSLERLKDVAVDNGRTVLVDFSAEWCLTCKVLEQTVLHTDDVAQAIAESGAVTMYADYTDYPDEIKRTILALRAGGVPVIAVFPGNAPYEPIVFRGGYTKQGLIEALEKATGRQLRGDSKNTIAAALN
jgi:thiol:disulfide interchange protein/DsbC/DsbD-like thiol-disulfide interchange protein